MLPGVNGQQGVERGSTCQLEGEPATGFRRCPAIPYRISQHSVVAQNMRWFVQFQPCIAIAAPDRTGRASEPLRFVEVVISDAEPEGPHKVIGRGTLANAIKVTIESPA